MCLIMCRTFKKKRKKKGEKHFPQFALVNHVKYSMCDTHYRKPMLHTVGGGGFILTCEDLGEGHSFPAWTFFKK